MGTTTPEMVAMQQTVPTPLEAGTDWHCHCPLCPCCGVKLSHWDPAVHRHCLNWGNWWSQPCCGERCSISSGTWGHVAGASSQAMSVPCPALPCPPGQTRTAAGPGGAGLW